MSTKLGIVHLCVKGIQLFMDKGSFNSQQGDDDFFLLILWHNHSFAQMFS